eukprot:XP_011672468.1 PREDICTED: uncharacterized protein LOC100892290 [Strongylocentrotus purpuratus]
MPTTTEVYNPTSDQANPEADLTCDSVSMTLIMDRTLLEIGDDARDVHFVDKSCVGYDHDSQHVAITTMYDGCGTTQEQDDDYIIFINKVTYYKPRPENGTDELITREHYLQIPVTCYLERTQVLEDSFLPEANLRVFEKVYVHCSILICDNNDSGSRCTQGCIARSRRSPQNTGFQSKLHTITNGPLSDASRSQRAMLLDSVYDL